MCVKKENEAASVEMGLWSVLKFWSKRGLSPKNEPKSLFELALNLKDEQKAVLQGTPSLKNN